MRFLTLPPQITRLILLVFLIVVSYLVARTLLTPGSFRDHGFYRGDALTERQNLPRTFAGKTALGEARPDIRDILAKGGHKTLSCEGCHGAMTVDQVAKGGKPPKPGGTACLRCHEANPTRPATFKQIVVKDHYGEACLECHQPHHPAEPPPDASAPAIPAPAPPEAPAPAPAPAPASSSEPIPATPAQ